MDLAFRVTLDIASDPDLLHTIDGFRLGDKFIVSMYAHHGLPIHGLPTVHEVKGILTQYIPNIRYPATRDKDIYLIADGLVITSDKATKVESEA